MKPSLDGVQGKITRAKYHLDDLKRVIVARPNTEALQTRRVDPQSQETILEHRLQEVPTVPLLARLLIGDVVHNLAAALDHMVYQLSLSHQLKIGTPDAVALCDGHKTHFPIFDSIKHDAVGRINKRLKLMAQAPADLIRAMQPYERAGADTTLDAHRDPLWVLYKLDVIDKHRVVLATSELVNVHRLTVSRLNEEPEVIEIAESSWHPFEHGAKILDVVLDPGQTTEADVQFHLHLSSEIQFAETGLWCDGKPVVALLRKLIEYIELIVINRLSPYVV